MVRAERDYSVAAGRKKRRAFRRLESRTPQYCIVASRKDEPLQFKVVKRYVPDGYDNTPTSPEQAYKNALECLRLKGKKTVEERAAEKKLPENVQASRAKSRRGKYIVSMRADKEHPKRIRQKFKKFSVVKPGTDGYYSEKGAVEVRDDFIKAKCPFEWCSKNLR